MCLFLNLLCSSSAMVWEASRASEHLNLWISVYLNVKPGKCLSRHFILYTTFLFRSRILKLVSESFSSLLADCSKKPFC